MREHWDERALAQDGKSGRWRTACLACALYHQIYMGFIPWTSETIGEVYAHAKISIECEDADEYCHWAMNARIF